MIDDQLTPEQQRLIQRIQATAKPKLDPAARQSIRQQVVTEFRTVVVSGQQPRVKQFIRLRYLLYVGAAMVIVILALVIFQVGNQTTGGGHGTFTITPSPDNQVAIVSSATTSPAETQTSPSIITLAPSVLTASPVITLAIAPTLTPVQENIVVIEGVVTSIVDNVITIYGFDIRVEPQHPVLGVIDVGDVLRVQGAVGGDGAVVASVVSNIINPTVVNGQVATVGLEGPVEAIDENIIIVNGIRVQLAPDDSLLQTIQLGNFVSVEGNFEGSGSAMVLVVVNIAIVNTVTLESECWFHEDGMGMGHWHCDGMGMGDAMGMGMGMGDAMGMGG